VFCLRKIVKLSNCLQEQQLGIFTLKMQVKHKYEVNAFNAVSFLLNKLQILKLFTGTIIIILLKRRSYCIWNMFILMPWHTRYKTAKRSR
jgi:hypothetical protein